MTINTKDTCAASVKGVTYTATIGTAILRSGLYEALPSSNYLVTLRAGEKLLGTGVWDGEVLLSGAHIDADPAVEQRVFIALQRALAHRQASA
jgi:hypothetical protein